MIKRYRNLYKTKKPLLWLYGDSDWIRTNDLLLRRQLLYPAELRNQIKYNEHEVIDAKNPKKKAN